MLSTLDLVLIRVALRQWGVPLHFADNEDTLLARFADVFAEKPIQAIKEFRAVSGLGLKESKDIWDRIKPLAIAAKERRDAYRPPTVDLKTEALRDLEAIIDDFRSGNDDEWTERSITRVRNFIENV